MSALVRATTNRLVRILLGPECAACGEPLVAPLDGPVCLRCWITLPRLVPPLCARCGDAMASCDRACGVCPRCLANPPAFERARSAGRYEGSLRRLIHAFKYDRRRMLAVPLAALLLEHARDVIGHADAVVPVPLHPFRVVSRGFNQADDLARRLGPPVWRALRRRRLGPPQASLSADERRANMAHAFARRFTLAPGLGAARLRHRTVVLVDDVMTTGATLDACSRVLVEAGVRSVQAVTVARAVTTPPPPPRPRHHPWAAPRR